MADFTGRRGKYTKLTASQCEFHTRELKQHTRLHPVWLLNKQDLDLGLYKVWDESPVMAKYAHQLALRIDVSRYPQGEGAKAWAKLPEELKTVIPYKAEVKAYQPHKNAGEYCLLYLECQAVTARGYQALDFVDIQRRTSATAQADSDAGQLRDTCQRIGQTLYTKIGIDYEVRGSYHAEPQIDGTVRQVPGAAGAGPGHWMQRKGSSKAFWLANCQPPKGSQSAWLVTSKGGIREVWSSSAADQYAEDKLALEQNRPSYNLYKNIPSEARYQDANHIEQKIPLALANPIAVPPPVFDKETGKVGKSVKWDGKYVPQAMPLQSATAVSRRERGSRQQEEVYSEEYSLSYSEYSEEPSYSYGGYSGDYSAY